MRIVMDHGINFPHGGVFLQSFCNQHVVSFQPKDVKSTTNVFLGDMNTSGGIIATTGILLTGNASTPNNISSMILTGNLPSNILLDPLPGLEHLAAFAVDWSCEELEVLKHGLVMFASEPTIMKYIKIAARLSEKTVRDVAIRCRWMTRKENGKQHKSEDFYAGKKIKDRKEKIIGCSSMVNMHYNQPDCEAACSVMMCNGNHMNQFSSEAFPVIDSRTMNILEDNAKLLHQIAVNSENNEIQNNIDLLYRTNNNITAILNSMLETPGIMSQMPPLPVYANENLLHSILRSTSQAHGHGNSYLQEEPSCW
uniref:Uncharacterized protein n=1 Tax=Musa acuminata subsp. malaccensis TaxID=214687 RepID=A0A804K683_MUSAM|nr:PREDICTED: uncharacterized protein LOC103994473 isoform X1 [Musa acuminata subsp. malaccensis]XP_009413093.1 PREDICTED: uncharacterized protein LOC103994473 isoform X1 [Musa acuminata subsp. malaccensis]XP_018686301.1 PREDICTED: uncharacterized protein LOC103994473 isoform X1 [Musa acuminata subsp. malaccensis]XP_018686302.1 PREDICTED: uncharacterized protein LOC103994473 isoform X1 [Musa acuminata subsp. malaccensis]XP_018686303.1 PREDICTED: uncharacterized protein LOC103994473 isoform X1 [